MSYHLFAALSPTYTYTDTKTEDDSTVYNHKLHKKLVRLATDVMEGVDLSAFRAELFISSSVIQRKIFPLTY